MSIVSVFAVLFLAMLLGMVMNVGRHVDGKLRMQNAADSAAYSGGVVLARGMNTLAFTNHLLCDVFAVTAVLREARDENSASYVPQILAAWSNVAPVFSSSGFPKFTALGSAIRQKVPLEQKMVDSYSAWAKSVSSQVLPMMEEIFSQELIPKYQRAVVVAFPEIAQAAAQQTAARNGDPTHRRGPMFGVLWRTDAQPVGGEAESSYSPDDRTLPVVDPELDSMVNQDQYVQTAVVQRRALSICTSTSGTPNCSAALIKWAKMSQFAGLWRSFTCGYLEHLLNVEYPHTNLPMVIYENPSQTADSNAVLENTTCSSAWSIGRSCRSWCRGCSRIPWRPMTRRLPRSICLFHAIAWGGSRSASEHRSDPNRRWAACPARLPMGPWVRRRAVVAPRRRAAPWVVGRGVGGSDGLEPAEPEMELPTCAGHAGGLGHHPANQSRICRASVPDSTSCRTWAG